VRAGAVFREGVAVTGLKRIGDAWAITTTEGSFSAPKVVNAAGAWADRIAAAVGEPVPLQVIAPMLMITSRVPAFIAPVVILRSRKLSFKQFPNGTVMIGGGHLARPLRDQNTSILDWVKLKESAKTVWDLFPVMRSTDIIRAWAGIEARMPDDIPVFGPSRSAEGLFHQFGFSAHGFQLGPGAGATMAELVSTGRTNIPIQAFDIARFR
jgi:sarcosine oxidase, subunit beta